MSAPMVWRLVLVALLGAIMFAGGRAGLMATRDGLRDADRVSLVIGALAWLAVPIIMLTAAALKMESKLGALSALSYLPLIASLVFISRFFLTGADTNLSGYYLTFGLIMLPVGLVFALGQLMSGNPGH